MKKLRKSQRGTAEIVGTVFFLVILLFFFSNVFLWYNGVSQQMNMVMGDKVSSLVGMETTSDIPDTDALKVTSMGGRDVQLLRIWIIEVDNNNHTYIDFEEELLEEIWVAGGSYVYIILGNQTRRIDEKKIEIGYKMIEGVGEVRFKILTDLGNTATAYFISLPEEPSEPTGIMSVSLDNPLNGSTLYQLTVSFQFIPVFSSPIENASLHVNEGTWADHHWNVSTVQNNTVNTIIHTFAGLGTFEWNIELFNSTHSVWAPQNYTLIISDLPEEP